VVSALAAIAGYLVGGIPVGLLIARARGVDLRQVGSGNIGATNLFRAVGAKYGLLGFALDVLKGFVPALLASRPLHLTGWALGAVALAAVVGHCFSPYLRFSGGKGVAPSLGVVLALHWPAGVMGLAVWILVMLASRMVSLGSIIALIVAPVSAAAMGASGPEAWALAAGAILCIVLHHENIGRLLSGKEHRFGTRKEATPQ
jgi:glycerol-3-phosphate acyltransferase PlsY